MALMEWWKQGENYGNPVPLYFWLCITFSDLNLPAIMALSAAEMTILIVVAAW